MALEQVIERLIVSLDANTAAMKGNKPATAGAATATTATAGKAAISFDVLKVAGVKVQDKHGKPFAKKLIADVGGAKDMATVKPEKYGALMKAFEAALEPAADPEPEEDDESL